MSFVNENSIQLRTRGQGGRPTLLKINPNRFNRVALSARLNDKWLNADLTIDQWWELCALVEAAAKSKVGEAYNESITCYKSEQPYGAVVVRTDNDGVVYLELASVSDGKIAFEFLPKRQYVAKSNGEPTPEYIISRRRALRFATKINDMVTAEWKKAYREDQAGPNGNKNNFQKKNYGGNGGGYNNNGGGQAPAIEGDLEDYLP